MSAQQTLTNFFKLSDLSLIIVIICSCWCAISLNSRFISIRMPTENLGPLEMLIDVN